MSSSGWDWLGGVWFAVSALMVVVWHRQSGGFRKCYSDAPVRHHRLSVIDLIPIAGLYLLALSASAMAMPKSDHLDWDRQNLANMILGGGQLMIAAAITFLAARRFDRSLQGFGFIPRQWGDTFRLSLMYYFAATGITLGVLTATIRLYEAFGGEMPIHSFLELMKQKPPVTGLVLLVILPAVIAPLAEELFFRGMIQSLLVRLFQQTRSPMDSTQNSESIPLQNNLNTPAAQWTAILITSIIFASFHPAWQHWPALIVLSVFMGYIYERHGNLWICIIVHSLFNLLPIALTLFGVNSQ